MIEPKNLVFLVAVVLAAIPIGLWLALYRKNHMEEQVDEKIPLPAATGNGIEGCKK